MGRNYPLVGGRKKMCEGRLMRRGVPKWIKGQTFGWWGGPLPHPTPVQKTLHSLHHPFCWRGVGLSLWSNFQKGERGLTRSQFLQGVALPKRTTVIDHCNSICHSLKVSSNGDYDHPYLEVTTFTNFKSFATSLSENLCHTLW